MVVVGKRNFCLCYQLPVSIVVCGPFDASDENRRNCVDFNNSNNNNNKKWWTKTRLTRISFHAVDLLSYIFDGMKHELQSRDYGLWTYMKYGFVFKFISKFFFDIFQRTHLQYKHRVHPALVPNTEKVKKKKGILDKIKENTHGTLNIYSILPTSIQWQHWD